MEEVLRASQYPKAFLVGGVIVVVVSSLYALTEYSIYTGKTRAKEFLKQTCTESLLHLDDGSTKSGCLIAISDDTYWVKPTRDGKPEEEITFIVQESTVKLIGLGEKAEKRRDNPSNQQSPK